MSLSSRLRHKAITSSMTMMVTLIASVYSCTAEAQDINDTPPEHRGAGSLNITSPIPLAADVNVHARPHHMKALNSGFDDVKPRITPCGNRLYFSRNFHPGNVEGALDSEDIWYSDFDAATSSWSEPIHLRGVLNNAGPNYVNNVSATGDTIILGNQYLKKGKMRAGLSYSVKVDGEWSAPVNIDIHDYYNTSEHENSFVALKNGIIISAIERSEGYGGRDLFVSFWDGVKATMPMNMGEVINTEFEESSPFLAADNKTLYFASRGHNGYGGFDIWMTKRLDDSWTNWSTPQNLGPAVNGKMDDEFFSITNCGKVALFSRQVNVHNTDLFKISMEELFKAPADKNKDTDRQSTNLASL
ncbi:MAG TPA: hypothetical protein VK658_10525 [Chryseolinea sp.]|nr:hypothetical protein [Chryseolinea sp.]